MRLATCSIAAAYGLALAAGSGSATVVTFEAWTQSNFGIENLRTPDTQLSVGSRVDAAVVTYVDPVQAHFDLAFEEGNGWTPNIVLTWPWGDNGTWGTVSEYDTYVNWDGRGSVAQAEIVYDSDNQLDLVFTPDPDFGVLVNSFDLDEWTGGGEITLEWQILDVSGILASGIVPLIEGDRLTVETGLSAGQITLSEVVTLRLSNANLTGEPWFVALDNLNFDQVSEGSTCLADLDGDGDTDQGDLGVLLASYGVDDGGDLDGDGDTGQADLGVLLADYGCGT
jgi:hypothetical protein